MEFIVAKCPNCGGELRLPDDQKQVKCMYCGFDVLVRESVNQTPVSVENLLKLGATAARTNNHQEAYDYFTRALEYDTANYLALLGKAIATIALMDSKNLRTTEIVEGIKAAVENSPTGERDRIKKQAVETISTSVMIRVLNSMGIIECLELAHSYEPQNPEIISSILVKIKNYASSLRSAIKMLEKTIAMSETSPSLSTFIDGDRNLLKSANKGLAICDSKWSDYVSKLRGINPNMAELFIDEAGNELELEKRNIASKVGGTGCLITISILILISTSTILFVLCL